MSKGNTQVYGTEQRTQKQKQYAQVVFDQGAKVTQWRKDCLSTNGAEANYTSNCVLHFIQKLTSNGSRT